LWDIASQYSVLLRLKFVTGSPLARSLAPIFPTPCGYFQVRLAQFLNNGGIAAAGVLRANAQAQRPARQCQ
jgi:hypothetical protein